LRRYLLRQFLSIGLKLAYLHSKKILSVNRRALVQWTETVGGDRVASLQLSKKAKNDRFLLDSNHPILELTIKIYFTANILQYLILHNTAGGSEYCNNIVESDVNCSSTVLFIHNCNGTASTRLSCEVRGPIKALRDLRSRQIHLARTRV
jgi:hypothetical protein